MSSGDPNRFDASVRQDASMAIIDLAGTIDGASEAALDDAYTRAAAAVPGVIALDFEAVDYINSTGIALLVGLLARARRDGLPVRAWGLSDHYREIFELTRLVDFLEIFGDEASAKGEGSEWKP